MYVLYLLTIFKSLLSAITLSLIISIIHIIYRVHYYLHNTFTIKVILSRLRITFSRAAIETYSSLMEFNSFTHLRKIIFENI